MFGKRRERYEEEDDGKTIVKMNVEGMPWYVPENPAGQPAGASRARPEPLTKEQLLAYKWAAVKAGLLVVLVFGVVFGAFIAFCDFVWFK